MLKTIAQTASLAIALAIGATLIPGTSASAGERAASSTISVSGQRTLEVRFDGRGWNGPDRHGRHDRRFQRNACSPDEALFKARRIGVRHARIVDVDRRSVTVVGRGWGGRTLVRFGRAPGCPVFARR